MSKYFFEYLVEKEIVSASDVVATFVEQAQSSPTQLEIIKESELFTDEQILIVLHTQVEGRMSPFEALEKQGLADEKTLNKLKDTLQKSVRTLGSLLVSKDCVSQKDYFKALHEFTSHKESSVNSLNTIAQVDDTEHTD